MINGADGVSHIQFTMIGGFLGAGKTTTLVRLARDYVEQGYRVGIVTNDQADNLVDTHLFRAEGFPVQEVPGACFCCKFDDLIETTTRLSETAFPDIILAEPVGSCTDLVATVVEPLRHLHGGQYRIAPFVVLLKPEHGLKILGGQGKGGFSPKAAYIFRKQLEEADCIAINKIDTLSEDQQIQLEETIQSEFSGREVLRLSARSGEGFPRLRSLLQEEVAHRHIPEVDYDIYAEGEAELGWHNSAALLTASSPFDLDDCLVKIVSILGSRLVASGAEIAHVKAIGLWEGFFAVVNLTGNEVTPELSLASRQQSQSADLVINARVAIDPAILEREVREVVKEVSEQFSLEVQFNSTQSFRPGRPTPTHRYAAGQQP